MMDRLIGMIVTVLGSLESPARVQQCVQCGELSGSASCGRDKCQFATLRPCAKCGASTLCFGDIGGACELAARIRRNKRGCKDAIGGIE